MNVPPHPHIGLQTVTWLLRGNVLHRDSLGSEQLIRPGQLNLMTSGRGIAHAEESVIGLADSQVLHGVQLWVALPDASRHVAPWFEHHAALPQTALAGIGAARLAVTVFVGELAGVGSPATTFSPIVGAELTTEGDQDATGTLPLRPEFEHVIFVASGQAEADGVLLAPGQLLYLPTGLENARVAARGGTSLFLLGGVPLGEQLLMWWNFVARTPDEIAAATASWRRRRVRRGGRLPGQPAAGSPAGRREAATPALNQLTRQLMPGSPATQSRSSSCTPGTLRSPGSARQSPATGLTSHTPIGPPRSCQCCVAPCVVAPRVVAPRVVAPRVDGPRAQRARRTAVP